MHTRGKSGQTNKLREHRLLRPGPRCAGAGEMHEIVRIRASSATPPRILVFAFDRLYFPSASCVKKSAARRAFERNSLLAPISRSSAASVALCACAARSTRSTSARTIVVGGSENVTVPSAESVAVISPCSICKISPEQIQNYEREAMME